MILFTYNRNRYHAPAPTFGAVVGLILNTISGGKIRTAQFTAYKTERAQSWQKHAAQIQTLLDTDHGQPYIVGNVRLAFIK